MEFFGNILPFLIFILIAISKMQKKTQRAKPAEKRNLSQEVNPSPLEQRMKKAVGNRDYKNIGNMLRQEINTAIGEMMEGKKGSPQPKIAPLEDPKELEDEDIIEQYIESEKERFQKKIETRGIQVDGGISDTIREKEIGRRIKPIRNDEMVRGIILSEVLGKPKSLKK